MVGSLWKSCLVKVWINLRVPFHDAMVWWIWSSRCQVVLCCFVPVVYSSSELTLFNADRFDRPTCSVFTHFAKLTKLQATHITPTMFEYGYSFQLQEFICIDQVSSSSLHSSIAQSVMKLYIYRGLNNKKVPQDVAHVIVDDSVQSSRRGLS